MRAFLAILLMIGAQWATPALAQQPDPESQLEATPEPAAPVVPPAAPPQPKSLDQLLEMVRDGFETEEADIVDEIYIRIR